MVAFFTSQGYFRLFCCLTSGPALIVFLLSKVAEFVCVYVFLRIILHREPSPHFEKNTSDVIGEKCILPSTHSQIVVSQCIKKMYVDTFHQSKVLVARDAVTNFHSK